MWFFRNAQGGCAYFDGIGKPWPKHPCMDGKRSQADYDVHVDAADDYDRQVEATPDIAIVREPLWWHEAPGERVQVPLEHAQLPEKWPLRRPQLSFPDQVTAPQLRAPGRSQPWPSAPPRPHASHHTMASGAQQRPGGSDIPNWAVLAGFIAWVLLLPVDLIALLVVSEMVGSGAAVWMVVVPVIMTLIASIVLLSRASSEPAQRIPVGGLLGTVAAVLFGAPLANLFTCGLALPVLSIVLMARGGRSRGAGSPPG